ncbi:hypothetical protein C471_03103 [Halorubrum saccharovorum DSM 1137]|uniref:Uncharacterized protein n=1 Tax=Halorubrum saccharovorum DSM 1137 TaxID=1227484 RepID=M0E659_9EURY|nr:hypothetical protein C471_03103 [Halorubrum saccharovorum DSM 1137]
MLVLPVLLYAVYHRNWRLAVAAVAFTLVNPVLFSPPEDDDAWMTRVVLAEEWWVEERGERVLGPSYPNLLNLLNVPLTGYAFVSAYRRNPVRSALGGAASMALKFWYVGSLVRRHDEERAERPQQAQ